ncbi:plasmid stability protein [Neorhizobium galegae]|uniref:FitA-like ribbon-helix-helix domain-containing protein n=1 Tax=Neorhizobium galegae TaxID=399 RepID=UPI001AE4C3C0|nr:plasmid stabilization protein [Neorhizobium galegae]MBP2548214.1 plasmid stability protein [Neorhizobium galegae]
MGDLLIRNLDETLKQELQRQARQSGRSLSEEAALHLRRSLRTLQEGNPASAGQRIRTLLGSDACWTPEELAFLEASRHAPMREPPRFDE